jgi:hypothetical protein
MEDVLDLYAEEPDRKRPAVCFDESPTQLIGEVRQPIKARPGQLERYDCEYKRDGTANLFIFLDVHRPWRKVKVTDSRTAVDFAACMQEPVDVHFPKAERIRVVLDNLSTHTAGALYQAFPPTEARRLLNRLEFHYVPKHASWLNMVEIEIGALRGQCLDRRIDSKERLVSEKPVRLPPGRLRLATKPKLDRIAAQPKNDWNVPRRRFGSQCRRGCNYDDRRRPSAYHIGGKRRQTLGMAVREVVLNAHVAAL